MGCAIADCGDPRCGVCSASRRFPALKACGRPVEDGSCRFVVGHPGRCSVGRAGRVERAELKPGKGPRPDLSAPRAAAVALGRVKRRRVGPHRGNA